MARGATPQAPERPFHTLDQKRQDIERLRRRIRDLEAFDPSAAMKRFSDPSVMQIQTAIDETLSAVFGNGTEQYRRYASASKLDDGPVILGHGFSWLGERDGSYDEVREVHQYLAEGKEKSRGLLNQAIRGLEEEIELTAPNIKDTQHTADAPISNKIFIVHGRSEGPREAVARFLEQLNLVPIILHEQANQGKTVIEKVEAHSNVGFAVVLLTPDDEGNLKGDKPQPRARQNVLLELGYFIGILTRKRVCTLKVGDLEVPSDWRGVIDEPFDGGWKQTLARELEAAGYTIDWNKVMRT